MAASFVNDFLEQGMDSGPLPVESKVAAFVECVGLQVHLLRFFRERFSRVRKVFQTTPRQVRGASFTERFSRVKNVFQTTSRQVTGASFTIESVRFRIYLLGLLRELHVHHAEHAHLRRDNTALKFLHCRRQKTLEHRLVFYGHVEQNEP